MTFNTNWIGSILALSASGIFGWYLWLLFVHGTVLTSTRNPKGWIVTKEVPLSRREHPIKFWATAIVCAGALLGCGWLALMVAMRTPNPH